MTVQFLQVAKLELDDAVDYYNDERPGLGYEFLWEVFFAIAHLHQEPDYWIDRLPAR